MNYNETKKVLEDFAREVVKGARKNLKRMKASGKLSRSIKSDVKVNPKSFELDFQMEGYGAYQDAGVDGKKKRYGKRKAGLPTYKYTTKMPPPKSLDKWVVRKGLKGTRDAKGRFTKRQSLTFIIARSIFMKGLEPTYFFTDAFEAAYKKLPKAFIDKYELDIDNFLKFTTK
jgi:hypothetical protein